MTVGSFKRVMVFEPLILLKHNPRSCKSLLFASPMQNYLFSSSSSSSSSSNKHNNKNNNKSKKSKSPLAATAAANEKKNKEKKREEVEAALDEDIGTDKICKDWFWGHADSEKEPPPRVPISTGLTTFPLRMAKEPDFHQQFAEYVLCPHWLDKQAQGTPQGQGCPFMGGKAFLRNADVKKKLAEVPQQHASGEIVRGNELGYLLLQDETFPLTGSLGLGNSVENHRIQRRWLEHLLSPNRLITRRQWVGEVQNFLLKMRHQRSFRFRKEVSLWWFQMLWKHIAGIDITIDEAKDFEKFQSAWLQGALKSKPNSFAEHHPHLMPKSAKKKIWPLHDIIAKQESYRDRIKAKLPQEVPEKDRDLVAQGVLEMFVFAGGLSIPLTVHAAMAALFRPDVLPSPVKVTEDFVEPFVYEVTRLWPAVQGFCYWKDGERQVLSLNAALRDPAVWGQDANRFTIKPMSLYREHHVGFANQAVSPPGQFDSKACPGFQLSLDVVQAFVLALAAWQPTNVPRAMVYWSPLKWPKPMGVHKKWWNDCTLEVQDWLDGDQTGEDLLRQKEPVELARLLRTIGMGDPEDNCIGSYMAKLGPSRDKTAGALVSQCDGATRLFYELSRKRFKELSSRAGSTDPNEKEPGPFGRHFDLVFGEHSETMRLPIGDTLKKKVRDNIAGILSKLVGGHIKDDLPEALYVRTPQQRCATIMLGQQAFFRTGGQTPPPHSNSRPDSYLPKPTCAFTDITTDAAQVAVARCGMGQMYLRTNDLDHLKQFGDIVCDISGLHQHEVRPSFERLGATAVFKRHFTGSWELTAIDWKHGNRVVRPGEDAWEHAKWAWRCSLITHMTAVHHLVQTHWLIANALASSPLMTLPPFHPVRRLLQVFTYNTPSINHNSALSLFPESGMLHRMSPFPYKELQKIFASGAENYVLRPFPEEYKAHNLPEDVKSRLPIYQDGLEVYEAFQDFMAAYVGVYYPDDASVEADEALQEYWKFELVPQYAKALPKLTRSSLILQLSRGAFDVTALHELVGYVVAYTTDPAGAGLQVRPGMNMADLQQFIAVNSLVAGTGTPMPMLVPSGQPGDEDWLHQLDMTGKGTEQYPPEKFEEVSKHYRNLMDRFRQISNSIRKRNAPGAGREIPCGVMDPLTLERSVSL
mmetsp:Transcript_91631/g.200871  ORF Transcript_91631/g.200871 Transcript_91631/m.200871 type:complete len:1147 (-) Transcript_91631:374-3814(-)